MSQPEEKGGRDSLDFDPYASIRSALSPEHANLDAGEISSVLGHVPAALALQELLDSPEMRQATFASLLGKAARRSVRVNGLEISIPVFLRAVSRLSREAAEQSEVQSPDETERAGDPTLSSTRSLAFELGQPGDTESQSFETFEIPHQEGEFRIDHLSKTVREQFSKTNSAAWRDAVTKAIASGTKSVDDLADLIFFMQHRDRIVHAAGQPIKPDEPDFARLRAERDLYWTIANRRLNPSSACAVFLPDNPSTDYEQYIDRSTTGLITLMVNGRTSGTPQIEAFDSMRQSVESLRAGDSLFIANWQFFPTGTLLNASGSGATWADLLRKKAIEGVKIRVIISDLPPAAAAFQTDLKPLDAVISGLPASARSNWKYIFSRHPTHLAACHHQKIVVAIKGETVIAYCGGLDISFSRIPDPKKAFVWHDVHAKLEGLIARDVEREFVLRWNREKDKSSASQPPTKKDLENLTQAAVDPSDTASAKNKQKLQMLRTVSVSPNPPDFRRNDIWQGYFLLIGCATRYLFMENQYFHEVGLADAIIKQTQAQPDLIVIIVVSTVTDDPKNPLRDNMLALRHEFFSRLSKGILPQTRLRVYTSASSLIHSKLIMVDDRALSMGSANANPRDFFLDTQINVMLDDPEAVKGFRQHLWAHDLGVPESTVASWPVSNFITQWEKVANSNKSKSPDLMVGEHIIPFENKETGKRVGPFLDIYSEQETQQSIGEFQESANELEQTELSETAESSPSEYSAETEHADLTGESAPWLQENLAGDEQSESEYEWRDAPIKKRVADSFAIPFRWICKVSILRNGKYESGGSGVLISDRHVLTAAHVVYDVIRDPVQYDLEVTIALDGGKDLGRFVRSGKPQVPSLYGPNKTDYDYALITLSRPVGQSKFGELQDDKLCFWGSSDCGAGTVLVRVDPTSLVTQTAYTAGYPKSKGTGAMWCFSGLLAYVGEKDRTMTYTADVTEGQSGSPVWIQREGKFILVGVVVARGTTNRVVRVTREFCRQLASWMGTQQKEAEAEAEALSPAEDSEELPSIWLGRAESEEPEDREFEAFYDGNESVESESELEWPVSDREKKTAPKVTPEIILVCGLNYPKFAQSGSLWQRARPLSPGDWREYCLRLAVNRLTTNPIVKVTLFDFLLGTLEDVTLASAGKAKTTVVQQFSIPVAEDYRDLSGIDWSAPAAAQVMAASIDPIRSSYSKKPQLAYFDGVNKISPGKSIKLTDYLSAMKKVTSPTMSITDVYNYVSGFAAAGRNAALLELHFFSHAFNISSSGYSGGPILVNSLDNPFQSARHPLDKDARSAKDFQKPVIDPGVFSQAFAANARSFVWGCNFQQGFVRQFAHQVAANRKDIASGKSISVNFDSDWGTENDFRTALGLGSKDSVRKVTVDPAKVQKILNDANQQTFMQKLATASGHPAIGAPAGTYADYDDNSGSLKLMHVPMTKAPFGKTSDSFEDALVFYRDQLKASFDTTFGDHHGLGRGYMIFQP